MMKCIKNFIKKILTVFYNWNKLIYFNKIGRNFFLGKRTIINKCKEGKIFVGKNVRIGNDARFGLYKGEFDISSIMINDNCYIGNHCTFMTASKILIEKNVLMASYISIIGHNHGINPELENYGKQELTSKNIIIKEGAWIGEHVIILPGTEIGKKSIVGAGSVVTKTIPDYCIAVGNPAKIIKKYNFEKKDWENIK